MFGKASFGKVGFAETLAFQGRKRGLFAWKTEGGSLGIRSFPCVSQSFRKAVRFPGAPFLAPFETLAPVHENAPEGNRRQLRELENEQNS